MDDQEALAAELADLRERMENHPAKAAEALWHGLRTTSQVVVDNGQELENYIDFCEGEGIGVAAAEAKGQLFSGLLRHLSNYVSSAMMLVDHTRNMVRQYEGQAFAEEYEARKEALVQDHLVALVRALRNYSLHVGHPAVAFEWSWDAQGVRARFLIEPATLRRWDKCPAGVRRYLEERGDESIPIKGLIVEHGEVLTAFYTWLFEQFSILHGAVVEDFNSMVDRRDELFAEAKEEGPAAH